MYDIGKKQNKAKDNCTIGKKENVASVVLSRHL